MKMCPNKSSELYKELLKLNNNDEGLATDSYTTIGYLQDLGLISQKRFDVGGTMKYMIPMQNYTTKQIPGQLKGNYSKVKNEQAFIELERVLEERNINWIKVKETANSYVVTLQPNDFYEQVEKTSNLSSLQKQYPEVAQTMLNLENNCR